MATYTRQCFSANAERLTRQAYKGVALIAETFVFVYLGMACITFPIFEGTVYALLLVSLLACLLGRLHIYAGSLVTNCFRITRYSAFPPVLLEEAPPPPISAAYMFVMWFSGLRGGVAFALASNIYSARSFNERCGGYPVEGVCEGGEQVTDDVAILQSTMLIAVFTIFVLGGAITKVAVKADVLKKEEIEAPSTPSPSKWMTRMHTRTVRWLTSKQMTDLSLQ